MRFLLMLVILTTLALATDYYIYRRVFLRSRHNFSKRFRRLYRLITIILDVIVAIALLLRHFVADEDQAVMFKITMWAIGIFFLNFVPKFTYAVVSLGDYVVQLFRKGRISHIFGVTGGILALVVGIAIFHGMFWGRSVVRTERVELFYDKLPPSFDGVKVAMFTDMHLGVLVNQNRFINRVVETINSNKPDIIINAGDLVNTYEQELDEDAIQILSKLKARYGIYSVLGNHDLGIYIQDTVRNPITESVEKLIDKQRGMGWNVLLNDAVFIYNGEDSIAISGLNYPDSNGLLYGGQHSEYAGTDMAAVRRKVPQSMFNICITHTPQTWDSLRVKIGAELALAGHIHASQLKIKIGKRVFSPASRIYKEWSGLYEKDGKHLYINDGIGYVMFPIRVGAKPEVTIFTLRSIPSMVVLEIEEN